MPDNKSTGPTGNETHDKAIAEIWALFKESEARRTREAENQKKEDEVRKREADARQAKAEARLAKTEKLVDKMSKEISRLSRKLSKEEGQWGRIAESLVGGGLIGIMKKRFGVVLDCVSLHTKGEYNNKPWEIDVIGVNSNIVVIVEVKTTLDTSHTNKFINSIVNRFPKLVKHYEKGKIYAGIAYVRTSSNEAKTIEHAEQNGLFAIKVINDTSKVVNSPDFKLHDHQANQPSVAE